MNSWKLNNRRIISMPVAAACLVVLARPAHAQTTRTHSFEGSCAIVGYAELRDPMTPVPTQSWFRYRGKGRCMGTLDGKVLPERGVRVRMGSEGPRAVHSCAVGYDPGTTWRIRFDLAGPRRDVTIHGDGDIIDVLRSQNSVFRGQRDGVGVAVNMIQGHAETLDRCFSEGITAGSVGIQLDTITPLVSDDGPARPGNANSQRSARSLRLSVLPRGVRGGEAARLRFRTTALLDGRRRPVRGAMIRLAGRRVRTNRRGRASLVVRLQRAGRRRVTASLPTGATAATTIRVVRRADAQR